MRRYAIAQSGKVIVCRIGTFFERAAAERHRDIMQNRRHAPFDELLTAKQRILQLCDKCDREHRFISPDEIRQIIKEGGRKDV